MRFAFAALAAVCLPVAAQDLIDRPLLHWASYIPDVSSVRATAVAPDGDIWIAGETGAGISTTPDALQPRFSLGGYCEPTTCSDGYLMRFTPSGKIRYATYFGGSGQDSIHGLHVASEGTLTVVGATDGMPAYDQGTNRRGVFVARLNAAGTGIQSFTMFAADVLAAPDALTLSSAADRAGNTWLVWNEAQRDRASISSVYRSENGEAWQLTDGPAGIADLASAPSQPSTVYAAGRYGIWRSDDAGLTWTRLSAAPEANYAAVAVDPRRPEVAFASAPDQVRVWRTTDRGATWQELPADAMPSMVVHDLLSDPATGSIYAGGAAGLFRSLDSGATWVPTALAGSGGDGSGNSSVASLALGIEPGVVYANVTTGAYRVSNSTAARIYVGGVDGVAVDPAGTVWLSTYDRALPNGLMKSADGGASWTHVRMPVSRGVLAGVRGTAVYYAGNRGLYVSENGGGTWDSVRGLPADMPSRIEWAGNMMLAAYNPASVYRVRLGKVASSGTIAVDAAIADALSLATAIAVDNDGRAWVAGWTRSATLPAIRAVQAGPAGGGEGFLMQFSADGRELLLSTLYGTEWPDSITALSVDTRGGVIAALASSPAPYVDSDSRLVRIDPSAGTVEQLADLPGSTVSVLAAAANSILFAGETKRRGLATEQAFQRGPVDRDAFVGRLGDSGHPDYLTYYGGTGQEGTSALAPYPDGGWLLGLRLFGAYPPASRSLASHGSAMLARFSPQPLAAPVISQGAVVNGADFAPGAAVAPGSIASIFGTDLALGVANALNIPLPAELLGTSVTVNGVACPLFYVSPEQINFQVPFGVAAGTATVQVRRGSDVTAEQTVRIAPVAPGIFEHGPDGYVIALYAGDYTSTIAAAPGQRVLIYATGLGAVAGTVETGAAATALPVTAQVVVTLGGRQIPVEYAGLAAGYAGLYQVNLLIPEDMPPGVHQLVLTVDGVEANRSAFEVYAVGR